MYVYVFVKTLMSNLIYNLRCDVCLDVPYVETFDVKFSAYGTSKILCMSLSVIEAYDRSSSTANKVYNSSLPSECKSSDN